MKSLLFTGIVQLFCLCSIAQDSVTLVIKGKHGNALPGATVLIMKAHKSFIADSAGTIAISNLATGSYGALVSSAGYEDKQISFDVTNGSTALEVLLEYEEKEEEEVVVTATRLSRTIANVPTRVEVISGEELEEKGNMRPGEIRMLLSESTGIQVQQTSATSFNAGIRIQGLDGRYTQILKDGYPLYSGFSGSLSIMQIPPLDLRQVEVIKGSASTLYGGGAIAGIVNLVSKTPSRKKDLEMIANGTSAGGLDISAFYSQRYGKAGLTVFGSRNSNKPFDPANIGLTAIPKFKRYAINPRLFLYGKRTTADFGIGYITENRLGGSVNYIKHGGSGFFEKNLTDRVTTQLGFAYKLNDRSTVQLKNSYRLFDRIISIPGYDFDAVQQSSFTELTWNTKSDKADWVFGMNFLTEDLKEKAQSPDSSRDYHFKTYGVFVQNATTLSGNVVLESGLRGDFVKDYGFELLPRVSIMLRVSPKVTTRIGGGLGYKTPTIFTEETERLQFRNVLPIDRNASKNERSIGTNWDLNYRTHIGNVGFTMNYLVFYTKLNDPLILVAASNGFNELQNAPGHLDTKGIEANIRLVYAGFKLFLGYTLTDANTHFSFEKKWLPLTSRHRLNNILMWEKENSWKAGLEAYYYSRQELSDGSFGKSYWVTGFMAEKIWNKVSLYINFENLTDTRQSKFDSIFTGTITEPRFNDIYAPVEGFVVNGGIKLRL
jgi:outer membrane receptor for ferrienterochelin and colicins